MFDSQPAQTVFTLPQLYEELKYWGPLITAGVALYKVLEWIKGQATTANGIKESVTVLDSSVKVLDTNVKDQTALIVAELKELRSDLRTFYAPLAAGTWHVTPKKKTA